MAGGRAVIVYKLYTHLTFVLIESGAPQGCMHPLAVSLNNQMVGNVGNQGIGFEIVYGI